MALVVILFVAGSARATYFDFSTDPNMGTAWTNYNSLNPGNTWNSTATWNAAGYLEIANTLDQDGGEVSTWSPNDASLRGNSDAVTLTVNGYTDARTVDTWSFAHVGISDSATPAYGAGNTYRFGVWAQGNVSDNYALIVNGVRTFSDNIVGGIPSSVKLDVVPDATGYSFRANGTQIFHDTTNHSVEMPHYFFETGVGATFTTSTVTAQLDNFGVTPEPGTLVLVLTGLVGLLAYAWRKRK
jgi:hypothetical protein